jgi:predicted DNA-binding transcriptional regulator AlpA
MNGELNVVEAEKKHVMEERLLRLPDVIGDRKRGIVGLIPMSKSTFYQGIPETFPPPVRIGGCSGSFWKLSEIMQVIDSAAAGKGDRDESMANPPRTERRR